MAINRKRGKRIKHLLDDKDLSFSSIARDLDVKPVSVSEAAYNKITSHKIRQALANAIGESVYGVAPEQRVAA